MKIALAVVLVTSAFVSTAFADEDFYAEPCLRDAAIKLITDDAKSRQTVALNPTIKEALVGFGWTAGTCARVTPTQRMAGYVVFTTGSGKPPRCPWPFLNVRWYDEPVYVGCRPMMASTTDATGCSMVAFSNERGRENGGDDNHVRVEADPKRFPLAYSDLEYFNLTISYLKANDLAPHCRRNQVGRNGFKGVFSGTPN